MSPSVTPKLTQCPVVRAAADTVARACRWERVQCARALRRRPGSWNRGRSCFDCLAALHLST
jgi:hypothetical protein